MEGDEFCGVDDSLFSFALPHPPPPLGTKLTVGSLPEFSLFKDGKLAGGGIRRLDPIFPRLCNPWRVAPRIPKTIRVIVVICGKEIISLQQTTLVFSYAIAKERPTNGVTSRNN